MNLTLAASIARCRAVTRAARSSFPLAFRLLPPAKRRAMDALYAFMRVTDDLADEPGEPAAQRAALGRWRAALAAALRGEFSHPVHPALYDTVRRFDIPPRFLFDVIDGVHAGRLSGAMRCKNQRRCSPDDSTRGPCATAAISFAGASAVRDASSATTSSRVGFCQRKPAGSATRRRRASGWPTRPCGKVMTSWSEMRVRSITDALATAGADMVGLYRRVPLEL